MGTLKGSWQPFGGSPLGVVVDVFQGYHLVDGRIFVAIAEGRGDDGGPTTAASEREFVAPGPIAFGGSDATVIPQGLIDGTSFEGALLALALHSDHEQAVLGTAVIVAPGLAVTATHVFRDRLDEILAGTVRPLCVGPASAGLDLWHVLKVSCYESDDIAFLSLQLASPVTPNWRFRTIAVTTREPRPGETVTIVGFHMPTMKRDSEDGFCMFGNLYAAAGSVTNAFFPMRDKVLMPYPVIEISCGSLGGMSGGAVLDARGYLLGVTSRGLQTEDQAGPSFASWIVGGLNRRLEIPWPPGVYGQPTHLLEIDDRALRIEGREHIRTLDENSHRYKRWSDK